MGSMMEKKSHNITYDAATSSRPPSGTTAKMNDYYNSSILYYLPFQYFLVYFSVQLSMEQLYCCTCPNSKNDALSCLAEPKNAVFYDSAVGLPLAAVAATLPGTVPLLMLLKLSFSFFFWKFFHRDAIAKGASQYQTLSCMDATMSIVRLFHTY